jgi:hypothetical protein
MEPKRGTCPMCGREFERARTGRPRLTCSNRCRVAKQRLEHGPLGSLLLAGTELEGWSPLRELERYGIRV